MNNSLLKSSKVLQILGLFFRLITLPKLHPKNQASFFKTRKYFNPNQLLMFYKPPVYCSHIWGSAAAAALGYSTIFPITLK